MNWTEKYFNIFLILAFAIVAIASFAAGVHFEKTTLVNCKKMGNEIINYLNTHDQLNYTEGDTK